MIARPATAGAAVPLCVDLEGALTPVDVSVEALLSLLRQAPAALLSLPFWLRRGRSRMNREIAARVTLDTARLPLNRELLEWLQGQRAGGRRLVLVSAADARIAGQIAAQVGLFDEVIAGDGKTTLSGGTKRALLIERFGDAGFEYVAHGFTPDAAAAAAPRRTSLVWIKAMRLHQWVKNALIFIPALLAHQVLVPTVFAQSAAAFLAFGLCASSVYLVNDLLDLTADRQHPRKRERPFASGALSARSGLAAALLLFGSAALLALIVGPRFAAVLGGYYVLTWAYSLRLKRAALVDVMTLAGLYTLRIIAGAAATGIALSFWLLAFSIFIFLSLGFVKRYTELDDARQSGKMDSHGRGYLATDLPLLMTLGIAAGYCTVVVMALYINSTDSQALYRHNKPLWLVCPLLLYWISRMWLLTTRGQMRDDPVVFALRDGLSLIVLALLGLIVLISM